MTEPTILKTNSTVLSEPPLIKNNSSTTTFLAKQGRNLFKSVNTSHIAESEPYRYDYSTLPNDVAKELKNVTTNIRVQYRNAVQSISKIGQLLIDIKDMLPYGQWSDWIYKEFTETGYFTIDTSQNYMNLARLVNSKGLENLKDLPLSVLYLMSKEEESFIDFIIDKSKTSNKTISRTQYKEIKQQYQSKLSDSTAVITPVIQSQSPTPTIEPATSHISQPSVDSTPPCVVVEEPQNLTFNQLTSIEQSTCLYHKVFYFYNNSSKTVLHKDLSNIKFNTEVDSLCFIYSSSVDLLEVLTGAKDLNYIFTISINKPIQYNEEFKIRTQILHCSVFYTGDSYNPKEYLFDSYNSHNSFVAHLLQVFNFNDSNTLIYKANCKGYSLFDDNILYQINRFSSLYIVQT